MAYFLTNCQVNGFFEDGERRMKFSGPCVQTGKSYSVTVPASGVEDYVIRGQKMQEAFPSLSTDDREFLISGFSPEGWESVFGSDDF